MTILPNRQPQRQHQQPSQQHRQHQQHQQPSQQQRHHHRHASFLSHCKLRSSDRRLLKERLTELETHTQLNDLKEYIQHGDTSCYMHSLAVAYVSFFLVRQLHLRCHFTSLLIGALLHDYFLYDWHDRNRSFRWHGFRHPGIALKNARRDWHLDRLEADIIKHHMFPLTPVPPSHLESIIVCIADKLCSTYEIFRHGAYGRLKRELRLEN